MKNYLAACVLGAAPVMLLATPAMAQEQDVQPQPEITVSAPADLTEEQVRDWQRLERQALRLTNRIASRERAMTQEQREVANAQDRLARAEASLRDEERELQRATDRFEEARAELDRVEQRMLAMGGQRVEAIAIAPVTP